MFYRPLFTALLLLMGFTFQGMVNAQVYYIPQNIDTSLLMEKLPQAKGEEKAEIFNDLAYYFRISDPERSIKYSLESRQLLKRKADEKLFLSSTYNLGLAYFHWGNYPLAVSYGLDALDLSEKFKEPRMWLKSIDLLVLTYLYSNNSELALNYAFKAKHLLDKSKSEVVTFDLLIKLGWVCKQTANYRLGIPYFIEAEKYAGLNDSIFPASRALNLFHLGTCYYELQKYDSALSFFKAADIIRKEKNLLIFDRDLTSIGKCYTQLKQADSAYHYFLLSKKASESNGEEMNLADVYIELADYYNARGQVDSAVYYFKNAIVKGHWVAENHSFFHEPQKNIDFWFLPNQNVPDFYEVTGYKIVVKSHRKLSEILLARGDYLGAFENLSKCVETEKLLTGINRRREVSELNTRYETVRKDQQIQTLEREMELKQTNISQSRYIIWGMVGLMLLSVIVFLLLLHQRNVKSEQNSISLQQRLLRSQMNPHFIYNSLSCIQSFILSHEPEMANKYLAHFAKLMRKILNSTTKELVALEDEIITVENYMELQKVRFPDKFDFVIKVDNALDTATLLIPPMIAQPFIENAIEHGIKHKETKGLIEINFRLNTGFFIYEIRDDGVGREKAKELQMNKEMGHKSMATTITSERLKAFNRKRNNKIAICIMDHKNETGIGCGTSVIFKIPLVL
ncbi:MAG: histidine kinase [Lentimicrobium sp.]|jgi:tetratricopeptide (TPR) repeat protein|nr:histidine kinase [Lentimicrobium sp.]